MDRYSVIESREIYRGRAFSFYSDRIVYNGKEMVKDYVAYPEAVAIIPVYGDRFILIGQFRYSIRQYIYEIPAGKMEKGENPEECAIRELEEETGFRARRVEKLFEYYPAVGYSSEKIHVFVAYDLVETSKNLDEDEFTDVKLFSYDEVVNMIRRNEIRDAKTIIAFLWYDKFLRGEK
jgi:ADP-ribose pyrophosphatase